MHCGRRDLSTVDGRLIQFYLFIFKVLQWVRSVGLQYTEENTGIGVCLADSEDFYTKHEEFSAIFEVS